MRLTDRHKDILQRALSFGAYVPTDAVRVAACIELVGAHLLEPDEKTQGRRYHLTAEGERVAEAAKSAPKSASIYVFATA